MVGRALIFLAATILYGGIWLGLALVFSVVFRQSATAALASIAVWLFFTVFWGMIAGFLAQTISPVEVGFPDELLARANTELAPSRVSPNTLYAEVTVAMLRPGNPLPWFLTHQSAGRRNYGRAAAVIPVAAVDLASSDRTDSRLHPAFALAYILFQRQEIRA